MLTLKMPITTKVTCLCHLLKPLKATVTNSVDLDQTAPIGSSLIWVHTVCFHTFISNVLQLILLLFATDDFGRLYFQMLFMLAF